MKKLLLIIMTLYTIGVNAQFANGSHYNYATISIYDEDVGKFVESRTEQGSIMIHYISIGKEHFKVETSVDIFRFYYPIVDITRTSKDTIVMTAFFNKTKVHILITKNNFRVLHKKELLTFYN